MVTVVFIVVMATLCLLNVCVRMAAHAHYSVRESVSESVSESVNLDDYIYIYIYIYIYRERERERER